MDDEELNIAKSVLKQLVVGKETAGLVATNQRALMRS